MIEQGLGRFRFACLILPWYDGIFSVVRGRGTALRLPSGATARAWPLQIEKIRTKQ